MKLEELKNIIQDNSYFYMGHGTGRNGNSSEIVQTIFDEGLRTKDNSLYYTTVGLDTTNLERLKERLNNWQHLNSKKIIMIRIPIEYINIYGDTGDLNAERYGAFMLERENSQGKKIYYLNPKFIIGCYDVEKQLLKLNPNFEEKLTDQSIKELKENLKKAQDRAQERYNKIVFPFHKEEQANNTFEEFIYDDFDWNNWSEDLDWNEEKSK